MLSQVSYNQRLFGSGLRAKLHVARFHWLNKFLSRQSSYPDTIFELGCYDAKTLNYLPRLPKEYVGCDANWENGLDIARRRWAQRNFEFHECSRADDIRFIEGREFDLVICMETFEHIPAAYLNEYIDLIAKIAKKQIIVTVPNEKGLIFLVKYALKRSILSLKGKETESYSTSDIIWSTLGQCDRVSRGEHKGFDYREIVRRLEKYFVIEKVGALPFTWLPQSLGFTICIVGRKRAPCDAER